MHSSRKHLFGSTINIPLGRYCSAVVKHKGSRMFWFKPQLDGCHSAFSSLEWVSTTSSFTGGLGDLSERPHRKKVVPQLGCILESSGDL